MFVFYDKRLEDFLYDNVFAVEPPPFLNFPSQFTAYVEVSLLVPSQRYQSMRLSGMIIYMYSKRSCWRDTCCMYLRRSGGGC